MRYYNGMPGAMLGAATWVKARASNSQGNCVEIARLDEHTVGIRNSREPDGPVLVFPSDEVATFVAGARAGYFDRVITNDGAETPPQPRQAVA